MNRLSMPLRRDHTRRRAMRQWNWSSTAITVPAYKAAHPVVKLFQTEFDTNLRFAYRHSH